MLLCTYYIVNVIIYECFCCRFSDVQCKKCIIGLLKHISEVYKNDNRRSFFIKDLMQLDVPKLFQCSEEDQSIQKLFNEMVSTFIKENALKEVILSQVIEIMVCKLGYIFISPCSISLSTIVLNSSDRQGKLWLPIFLTSNNHLKTDFC